MKRILLTMFSVALISATGFGQSTTTKVNSKSTSTTVVGDQQVTTKTHTIRNPGISKTTTTVKTKPSNNAAVVTKNGSLDKRYKANKFRKKNGTPDRRYNQNKNKN